MEEVISVEDICRLCLTNNSEETLRIFFDITADIQKMFEEITNSSVIIIGLSVDIFI